MASILITGSSSGLGAALLQALKIDGHTVHGYDIKDGLDVSKPDLEYIVKIPKGIDILINCAGINKIDWLPSFSEDDYDKVMNVNAKGIFMMSKVCLPLLIKSKGTILNIVSNASHMPMTCSLAYNASKAAAHMMTLQMARELTKQHGITVFGISPNKLEGTEMSKDIEGQVEKTRGWTKEYANHYQLNSLLTGKETPVNNVAMFIQFLLSKKENHKYLTGCVIPYGA